MSGLNRAVTRRGLLKSAAASLGTAVYVRAGWADAYRQATTDWFARCRFGISSHWTAQSQPVGEDDWLPFEDTVNRFSPQHYVDQIVSAGAEYVIFTSTHALQMLAAPCEAIDRVLPGRTTPRDMLGELADACAARNVHFILYYNHSCNSGDDPEWEYAVGYHASDKSRLTKNLIAIVRELGKRYGPRLQGWWFDSCFSLDPRGTYDSVTTDLHGFQFPWEQLVDAAKAGSPDRLVSLSSGMLTHYVYSTHQDYEGGEANDLVGVPTTRWTSDHLQGHRWVCLDNAAWVHHRVNTPLAAPRFKSSSVEDYVRTCNRSNVPVTFNVDIDRTGQFSPESIKFLRGVKDKLTL
jgi:hypothetical protein